MIVHVDSLQPATCGCPVATTMHNNAARSGEYCLYIHSILSVALSRVIGRPLVLSTMDVPDDCLLDPSSLPKRPLTLTESHYERWFAMDVDGKPMHDQYMYVHRNGLCIIGLAPTHPIITNHRETGGTNAQTSPSKPSSKCEPSNLQVTTPSTHEGSTPSTTAAAAATVSQPLAQQQQQQADGADPLGSRSMSHSCALKVTYNHSSADLERTKTTGKRKMQGTWLDPLSNLCFVQAGALRYKVKALVRGKLLELNERLRTDASALIHRPTFHGYVGILAVMPRELAEAQRSMVTADVYMQKRGLSVDDLVSL